VENQNSAYTVSLVSTKGGVGKTTLTANIAALCADLGLRVLVIDCDKQASMSKLFKIAHHAEAGLGRILRTRQIDADCISRTDIDNLDLILWDADVPAALEALMLGFHGDQAIEQALGSVREADLYDLVFIDTIGATGFLLDLGVVPADLILSPVVPEILSAREFIDGVVPLLQRYAQGAPGSRLATVPCKAVINARTRTTDAREITHAIRASFPTLRGRMSICNTEIPKATAYTRSATLQVPVHRLEPDSDKAGGSASRTLHHLVWELFPHLTGRFVPGSDAADDLPNLGVTQ
jgi:chromosome partitioning related protein ParA